ncbi:MAG: hypothetical protein ACI9IP_001813 [Arcticibacterium sp.]
MNLTLSNAAGSNTTMLSVNVPEMISLSGNTIVPKISGVGKIETNQVVQNQALFAEKSIQMNAGFQTTSGASFSSKIASGCQ